MADVMLRNTFQFEAVNTDGLVFLARRGYFQRIPQTDFAAVRSGIDARFD